MKQLYESVFLFASVKKKIGYRFDYRFPILTFQNGKRNNGRYRDLNHTFC